MKVIDDILDLILLIVVIAETATLMVLTVQAANSNKNVTYQTQDKTLTIVDGDNSVDLTSQDAISGAEIIAMISMLSDSVNLKYHTIVLPNNDKIVIDEDYNDNLNEYIQRAQSAIKASEYYFLSYNEADSLIITKK